MSELDIAGKLGFKDFVAFVMPGFIVILGFALLIRGLAPTVVVPWPADTAAQVWLGLAVLALSWILGVASSEALRGVEKARVKVLCRSSKVLGPVEEAFTAACREYFGTELPLDPDNVYDSFYVCRALVREVMPAGKSKIDRAGALRQAAKNVAVPMGIFGVGAAVWATSLTTPSLKFGLPIVLLAGAIVAVHALMVGAAKARLREIREAFWSIAALPAVRKFQNAKRNITP